jgi:hypothetical protein
MAPCQDLGTPVRDVIIENEPVNGVWSAVTAVRSPMMYPAGEFGGKTVFVSNMSVTVCGAEEGPPPRWKGPNAAEGATKSIRSRSQESLRNQKCGLAASCGPLAKLLIGLLNGLYAPNAVSTAPVAALIALYHIIGAHWVVTREPLPP